MTFATWDSSGAARRLPVTPCILLKLSTLRGLMRCAGGGGAVHNGAQMPPVGAALLLVLSYFGPASSQDTIAGSGGGGIPILLTAGRGAIALGMCATARTW